MTPHSENLLEHYLALANDVVMLDAVAQLALENARQRITYLARVAAIARYGTQVECPDIDRSVLLESILQLIEQHEREARTQEGALRAAYALREADKHGEWSQVLNVSH